MASGNKALRRSNSNSRTNLLSKDLRTLMNESPDFNFRTSGKAELRMLCVLERKAIGFSQRLVRGVRVGWRRSKKNGEENPDPPMEGGSGRNTVSGCLTFYGKGGGCRVGSCEEFEIEQRRKSNATEECVGKCPLPIIDRGGLEFLSHGVSEMFSKISSRKGKEIERNGSCDGDIQFLLPDDVLEMCLVRLPLSSLLMARAVCKKWRSLTTTHHFMRMRMAGGYCTPWLFLFGIIKSRGYASEIYALDVGVDQWHRITAPALQGRFLFSVASVGTDLYVVGGCSNLNRHSTVVGGRNSLKTHKGVFVFSPLFGSWCKVTSMKSARSGAVLGVFEVDSSYTIDDSLSKRQEPRQRNSRIRGVLDVYEDPHMCSVRRQLRDSFPGTSEMPVLNMKSSVEPGKLGEKRYILIAVGGHGSWDEQLDSGEIYDPTTDRWTQIAKLPADFGAVCSGAACREVFYVYSEADKLAGYGISGGVWVTIQTSRVPPRLREYYPKLVSCDDRLFMISVSWSERDVQPNRRDKAVRKLWELDQIFHSWKEAARHPDAPMDWTAAFVANGSHIYGVEMFKVFGQMLDFVTVCNVSDIELKWSRISREHATHEADASSCMAKTVAVLQL